MEKVKWVAVGNGHLAIGHRPGIKLVRDMKAQGATHVLTLISEKEGAKDIQKSIQQNKLDWLWFPMENATPPSENRYQEITKLFISLEKILESKGKVYMHCSAGIHRTGMIGNALLQFLGYDQRQSLELIKKLREVTIEQVGEHRIAWGDSVKSVLIHIKSTNI